MPRPLSIPLPDEIISTILEHLEALDVAALVSVAPNVNREWRAVCCDETYGPKVHLNLFELQKTLRIKPKYWYEWLESRINKFSWVVEINFERFNNGPYVVNDDILLKIAQMKLEK